MVVKVVPMVMVGFREGFILEEERGWVLEVEYKYKYVI